MTKTNFFIDSSFWIALLVKSDSLHQQAMAFHNNPPLPNLYSFTSDYVLDESLTRIKRKVGADQANIFYQLILKQKKKGTLHLLRLTKSLFSQAYRIFAAYPQPLSFSFTDATIVAVMRKYHIRHLLTFDTDFRALGISILP